MLFELYSVKEKKSMSTVILKYEAIYLMKWHLSHNFEINNISSYFIFFIQIS